MLLEPFTRFFVRHEMRFRAARERGKPLALIGDGAEMDAATIFNARIDAGTATVTLNNQDMVSLTKLDVRPHDDIAIFLFRRSDPDAATPIFEHRPTRRIRRADKAEDEAIAVSCHLFVDLRPVPNQECTYRTILEEVPGIGRTYVQSVIHECLKHARYEYIDHRGHNKDTYTLPDFHGIKSETIGGAMANSSIPYIELVRPGVIDGMDTDGLISPRDERMKLVLRAQPRDPMALLRRVKHWATANGWSDMKVQVVTPENRSRVVSVSREADAADVLFVRSEQIDVPTRMEACSDVINEELVAKAREIFAVEEGWS